MTGRAIEQIFPPLPAVPEGPPVLRAQELTTRSGSVLGASFQLRAGEILGFAGLVGSGKSEAARAVFGVEPLAAGRVWLDGAPVEPLAPASMLARGVLYLPPDRREEGLAMMRPARENMTMAALDRPELGPGPWLGRFKEARLAHELARRIELRPANPERAVELFSGGNQQKVLFARALARPVRLLMLDEPTVGVDMATRASLYRLIVELAEKGTAILLVSSDLPEILHLSHRVLVFHRGRIRAELEGAAIGEEAVLQHFFEREAA
ncbi:MAG: ATP-binding cassette domain-containing protein [Geminicoccaceae bacterium]|nr:ATP-binding cassette domain-containing protein [Geminicoccaceae bacterium]